MLNPAQLTAIIAFGFLSSAAASATATPIYKWVDERGVTHFGEAAPANANATRLKIDVPPPAQPEVATPASPAAVEAAANMSEKADKGRADIEKSPLTAAEVKAENCKRQQTNLDSLTGGRRVKEKTPDGGVRYLSDAEIDERAAKTRQFLEEHCAG